MAAALPALVEALGQHPEAAEEIPARTLRDYRGTRPPRVLRWLDKHPRLLEDWASAKRRMIANNGGKEHD